MALAGRLGVFGVLVLQLQVVFTNPTCICNGRNSLNPKVNPGTIQRTTNTQPNLGQATVSQFRLKDVNVQNIGHNLGQPGGQNVVVNVASPSQQQNALQSSKQQLSNPASTIVTNTAPARPTITLLDPATTDAFKSFLKSRVNADQTVTLPGQTRLPLSSIPVSFVNKCQNMPEVLSTQNQQRGSSIAQSQVNLPPKQSTLTPLQGQISLQSLLSALSSVPNQQPNSAINENEMPIVFESPMYSQQQNLVANQNSVPAVVTNPVPNNHQNIVTKHNAAPAVYNAPVQNQQYSVRANEQTIPSSFDSPVSNLIANGLSSTQYSSSLPYPQQNPMSPGFNSATPNQSQHPVLNKYANPTLPLLNSPALSSYADHPIAAVSQSQPQPAVPNQHVFPANIFYPQGVMPRQHYAVALPPQLVESPIQKANTNIKKLLPLLFDLVKESDCRCGSCNCPYHDINNVKDSTNNHAGQPHVNSGYANQISYGFTDKPEIEEKDNEVFESLGSLRDRLKLWKAKADSEENEQSSDTDEADE